MDTKAFVLQTAMCWVGLGYTNRGLCRVELSLQSNQDVESRLVRSLGTGIAFQKPGQGSLLGGLPDNLIRYFEGGKVEFDEPVDLPDLTVFQKQVLAATREIPYGEMRSYAWVANRLGTPRAFRAVGQALGRNPVAIIIPCHRVITSQGTAGGFGWGVEVKRMLLSIEGNKM